MSTSIEEWLERLQTLAEELRTNPSGSAHYDQLQQLLASWRARRAEVDRDFIVRMSFFLGKLSEKVTRTDVAALIEQLMQVTESGPSTSQSRTPRSSSQPSAAKPAQAPAQTPGCELDGPCPKHTDSKT